MDYFSFERTKKKKCHHFNMYRFLCWIKYDNIDTFNTSIYIERCSNANELSEMIWKSILILLNQFKTNEANFLKLNSCWASIKKFVPKFGWKRPWHLPYRVNCYYRLSGDLQLWKTLNFVRINLLYLHEVCLKISWLVVRG